MDAIAQHLTRRRPVSPSWIVICNGKKRCAYWLDKQKDDLCSRIWMTIVPPHSKVSHFTKL